MATVCKTYSSEAAARAAVQALTAAGVPGRDIRLLAGMRLHDVRDEPAGAFYGMVAPGDPVGTFANVARPRWFGAGTFAGDPRRQRQGSFADAERDTVVVPDHGAEHAWTSGDHAVQRLLFRFGIGRDVAARVLDDLHDGRAVVVTEVAEVRPREVEARLSELAPVA
jgi:hypothetical protein